MNETDHQLRLQTLDARMEKGIPTIKGVAEGTMPRGWSWLLTIKDLLMLPDLKNWGGKAELCG